MSAARLVNMNTPVPFNYDRWRLLPPSWKNFDRLPGDILSKWGAFNGCFAPRGTAFPTVGTASGFVRANNAKKPVIVAEFCFKLIALKWSTRRCHLTLHHRRCISGASQSASSAVRRCTCQPVRLAIFNIWLLTFRLRFFVLNHCTLCRVRSVFPVSIWATAKVAICTDFFQLHPCRFFWRLRCSLAFCPVCTIHLDFHDSLFCAYLSSAFAVLLRFLLMFVPSPHHRYLWRCRKLGVTLSLTAKKPRNKQGKSVANRDQLKTGARAFNRSRVYHAAVVGKLVVGCQRTTAK